jgi:hypothetical protein
LPALGKRKSATAQKKRAARAESVRGKIRKTNARQRAGLWRAPSRARRRRHCHPALKTLDLPGPGRAGRRINAARADTMEAWTDGGERVKNWRLLAGVAIGCALCGATWPGAGRPQRLLETARACKIQARAFYIQAAATLPGGQARAVLRLAEQAAREWPAGEAHSQALPGADGAQRVTLAAACPPDPARAQAIERRMRALLGERAELSTCLTGRAQTQDLSTLANQALADLQDAPRQALRGGALVSLTGARAQVALRADAQGAMVFLGCPVVSMEY